MELKEIIDRIGIIRIRANLSARALSLAVGKSSGYIHLLESKKNFEPSLTTLLDIISVCGATPEEFFYSDLLQYGVDKDCLRFFKTLSKTQKEAIMNLYK